MPNSTTIQSSFRFRDPMLFRPRAKLTRDAIELTGWHWKGRYRRHILLTNVLHTNAKSDDILVLWLADGEVIRLHLDNAGTWRKAISERLQRIH